MQRPESADILGSLGRASAVALNSPIHQQIEAHFARRTYDHWIQEVISETRDRHLFPDLNIPRSNVRSELSPDFADTSEKANIVARGVSWRDEGSLQTSSLCCSGLKMTWQRPDYDHMLLLIPEEIDPQCVPFILASAFL